MGIIHSLVLSLQIAAGAFGGGDSVKGLMEHVPVKPNTCTFVVSIRGDRLARYIEKSGLIKKYINDETGKFKGAGKDRQTKQIEKQMEMVAKMVTNSLKGLREVVIWCNLSRDYDPKTGSGLDSFLVFIHCPSRSRGGQDFLEMFRKIKEEETGPFLGGTATRIGDVVVFGTGNSLSDFLDSRAKGDRPSSAMAKEIYPTLRGIFSCNIQNFRELGDIKTMIAGDPLRSSSMGVYLEALNRSAGSGEKYTEKDVYALYEDIISANYQVDLKPKKMIVEVEVRGGTARNGELYKMLLDDENTRRKQFALIGMESLMEDTKVKTRLKKDGKGYILKARSEIRVRDVMDFAQRVATSAKKVNNVVPLSKIKGSGELIPKKGLKGRDGFTGTKTIDGSDDEEKAEETPEE